MKYLLSYVLFLFIFALDRLTKWIMISSDLSLYTITSWFSFDLQFNRGISWSLLHSESTMIFCMVTLLVIAVTGAVVGYAVYQFYHNKMIYGQTMVIAGSISNIMDRLMYGGVVDFIHIQVGQWSFAVFNIADVAIVAGVCLMLLQEMYDEQQS